MRNPPSAPHRLYLQSVMAFDSLLEKSAPTPNRLIVLLHGNGRYGKVFFDKFKPGAFEGSWVLAPDGPFPVNIAEPGQPQNFGRTWYFYDKYKSEYVLDMRHAVDLISKGISELGLDHLEKVIVGYSQGGYLSLSLAAKLTKVRQVIGVGCEFVHSLGISPTTFRVDGVHGEKDEVISYQAGRTSHDALLRQGFAGDFHTVPEAGHAVDDAITSKILDLLI